MAWAYSAASRARPRPLGLVGSTGFGPTASGSIAAAASSGTGSPSSSRTVWLALQRILARRRQGETLQPEHPMEALHELDRGGLHLLDRAGDKFDDLDRALTVFHVRQQLGQGLDRAIALELGDQRLLVDEGRALFRAERGERLVVAEDLGRTLEAVAPHGRARTRPSGSACGSPPPRSRRGRC